MPHHSSSHNITKLLATIWWLGSCLSAISCSSERRPVSFNLEKLGVERSGSEKPKPKNQDEKDSLFGDGKSGSAKKPSADTDDDEIAVESEEINYPLLKFLGNGILGHTNGEANVKQSLSAKMDDNKVVMTVLKFGAFGGDEQSRVNEAISIVTGAVELQRPSKESRSNFKNEKQNAGAKFLIFANRVSNRRGLKSDTFEVIGDPLPILVAPAAASRYEALKDGQIQYRSTVNGRYKDDDGDQVVKTFSVIATVSMLSNSEARTTVVVDLIIPEDIEGDIFEYFPIPKRSEFLIDHASKRVMAIDTDSLYEDDGQRNVKLNFALCEYVQNGAIDRVSSCDF